MRVRKSGAKREGEERVRERVRQGEGEERVRERKIEAEREGESEQEGGLMSDIKTNLPSYCNDNLLDFYYHVNCVEHYNNRIE